MVHHSPTYPGTSLAITKDSLRALWSRIASLGISVILTGHIHRYIGKVTRVNHRATTWDVLEARCGTTSQIDEIPAGWVAKGEDPKENKDRLPINSLLVHRLFEDAGAITWHCEAIARVHSGFLSKPQWVADPIQVWPR